MFLDIEIQLISPIKIISNNIHLLAANSSNESKKYLIILNSIITITN